jgi:hypothetical protein
MARCLGPLSRYHTHEKLPKLHLESNNSQVTRQERNFYITPDDPFFDVEVGAQPLDERADNALTQKMKVMEVYHCGYLNEIFASLEPPEGRLLSIFAFSVTYFPK